MASCHRHWRNERAGQVRRWIDPDVTIDDKQPEGRQRLGVGRRCPPVVQPILVAMPWAGNATIDHPALTQWPVLMGAEIRYGRQLTRMPEDGDRLGIRRSD